MVLLDVTQDAPAVCSGKLHQCARRVAGTPRHREAVEVEVVRDRDTYGGDEAGEDECVGILSGGEA